MKVRQTIAASAMALAAMVGTAPTASAAVIATLSFDTPTATVASNADIPVWMMFKLSADSDPITTDASSNVTSPLSAQVISDLHGHSTGVQVNESISCGDTLDGCNAPATAYTFNFNFDADSFVTPANLNLLAGGSLDILLGTFTPNGGNAAPGVYELNAANINFQYSDPQNFYLSSIAQTSTVFTRTVFAASTVPEPATWAMLLLGLFGVGFVMRGARRKDAIAVA